MPLSCRLRALRRSFGGRRFFPAHGVPLNQGRAFNLRLQAAGRNDRVSLKPAFQPELLAATTGPGSGGPSQQFVCTLPRVREKAFRFRGTFL